MSIKQLSAKQIAIVSLLSAAAVLCPADAIAGGLRGGGLRGGGGRAGGGRVGGGRSISRPSVPSMGSRRPSVSRPSPSRPTTRPSISRPSTSRPSISRPPSRPSGGLKPSTRPSTPSRPSNSRPSTRPSTRPSIPGLGGSSGNRPSISLPSTGNRPNIGNGNRPNIGNGNRPNIGNGNRPNIGNGNRPSLGGGSGRPSAGDLGDFLGMDKPLKPSTRPSTRPGTGDIADNRPNIGNGNRPNIGNGSGNNIINNRPVNIGQVNIGRNTKISNRPTWANIDRGRLDNINNRWRDQVGNLHGWPDRNPARRAYWRGWANGVHAGYHWHHRHPGCFRGSWWYGHPHRWGGWGYGYCWHRHPWEYWWTIPTFRAVTSWFTWQGSSQVWSEPVYYDYGTGGNVTYNDNSVYVNGEQVATQEEFAQSAADLATVEPPASEQQAEEAEWLALGTFAVSSGEKDVEPSRIVQLAVNKQGILSGALYNTESDQTQSVQGQVDKETQRVAFRIGENDQIVAEAGLYNLTQEEAPLLVHFGTERVENWLLVRLEDPAPEGSEAAEGAAPGGQQ